VSFRDIGLRPGEKIHELLISEHESPNTYEYDKDYYVILPTHPSTNLLKQYNKFPKVNFKRYESSSNLMTKYEIKNYSFKGILKLRIFVIGGHGMAGHMIKNYLECSVSSDVYYSIREQSDDSRAVSLDLTDEHSLYHFLKHIKPDLVINAAGILNDDTTKRLKEAIYINSLLPHKLASYGHELGFRLIHISTDCVFSGLKGDY
ncbi:sugar nucleotide-binding protein, partial [Leptospira santarosai]|nr:sugar nucleotide-binding protein [Leptospira santarosai]